MSKVEWFCHCCLARNEEGMKACRVCGRPESYVQLGHHLPLHGEGAGIYRPSHLPTVLENVFEADEFDWQALHAAAYRGNSALVRAILTQELNVDATTVHGHTPLILAVYSQAEECVSLLLGASARTDLATNTEKMTPLLIAASMGSFGIVKALAQNGHADIYHTDILGRSALHHAAIGGFALIGSFLIGVSAKRPQWYLETDFQGWSPRQTAEYYGHYKFQEMIVRTQLNVQQAVIRELPPAEWQDDLWFDLIERRRRTKEIIPHR